MSLQAVVDARDAYMAKIDLSKKTTTQTRDGEQVEVASCLACKSELVVSDTSEDVQALIDDFAKAHRGHNKIKSTGCPGCDDSTFHYHRMPSGAVYSVEPNGKQRRIKGDALEKLLETR